MTSCHDRGQREGSFSPRRESEGAGVEECNRFHSKQGENGERRLESAERREFDVLEAFWRHFGSVLFETKRCVCQSDSAIVRRKQTVRVRDRHLVLVSKKFLTKNLLGAFVSLTAR